MAEKSKRKSKNHLQRNYKFVFGLFFSLSLILFAIVVLSLWGISTFLPIEREITGIEAKLTISYFLGTEMPENAGDFYVAYSSYEVQDLFADIRFSVPSDEAVIWLDSINFCQELQVAQNSNHVLTKNFNIDWWHTDNATQFTRYEPCGDTLIYELFLDYTDTNDWYMYIQLSQP